jgi:hypothetical protein
MPHKAGGCSQQGGGGAEYEPLDDGIAERARL